MLPASGPRLHTDDHNNDEHDHHPVEYDEIDRHLHDHHELDDNDHETFWRYGSARRTGAHFERLRRAVSDTARAASGHDRGNQPRYPLWLLPGFALVPEPGAAASLWYAGRYGHGGFRVAGRGVGLR